MTVAGPESIPLGNSTALLHDQFSGWMNGARTRGTMDILVSCVTTIVLCVYTAIHLNVPAPGEHVAWQYLRKAKWVVIAILAPEIVVASAWSQFLEAYKVLQVLNAVYQKELLRAQTNDDEDEDADADARPSASIFNLTYGFFFIMGGMRMRRASDDRTLSQLPTQKELVTLAKNGIWWDITPGMIQDRSKADGLAKCLVLFQVSWMVAQCIARVVLDLPVTLLELHTFVHVVCALLMFALWFKKPLNAQEAVVITIDDETWDHLKLDSGSIWAPSNRALNINNDFLMFLFWDTDHEDFSGSDLRFGRFTVGRHWQSIATGVLQAVYGGLHLIAWNFTFPSAVEALLWKISAFSSVLYLDINVLVWPIIRLFDRFPGLPQRQGVHVSTSLVFVGTLFFILGRVFIVVETLISLRDVPIGVYAAVPWANFIPHL